MDRITFTPDEIEEYFPNLKRNKDKADKLARSEKKATIEELNKRQSCDDIGEEE